MTSTVGLAHYRAATVHLRDHVVRGVDVPLDFAPWVIYPEAACLAAHIRHGHGAEAQDMHDALRLKLEHLLDGETPFLDYPVAGTVLYALAMWELVAEDHDEPRLQRATRLLVLAEVFAYNRTLPSLGWAMPARLVEERSPGLLETIRQEYAGRTAPELRDEAQRLVAELRAESLEVTSCASRTAPPAARRPRRRPGSRTAPSRPRP